MRSAGVFLWAATMRKRNVTSASHPDEHDREVFAARVRAGRAILGWSQTALGKKARITQRAVHRIEIGAVQSREATVARIDKAFNEAGLTFQRGAEGFTMTVPLQIVSKRRLRTARRK
jgi:ribosome-binding protein aMBF1 (putative translation factor)